jgi:hypothetical protein
MFLHSVLTSWTTLQFSACLVNQFKCCPLQNFNVWTFSSSFLKTTDFYCNFLKSLTHLFCLNQDKSRQLHPLATMNADPHLQWSRVSESLSIDTFFQRTKTYQHNLPACWWSGDTNVCFHVADRVTRKGLFLVSPRQRIHRLWFYRSTIRT